MIIDFEFDRWLTDNDLALRDSLNDAYLRFLKSKEEPDLGGFPWRKPRFKSDKENDENNPG